jgi:hypothetical protein
LWPDTSIIRIVARCVPCGTICAVDFLQINFLRRFSSLLCLSYRGMMKDIVARCALAYFSFIFWCNFFNAFFSSNCNSLGIFYEMTLELSLITYNGPIYILKISYKFLSSDPTKRLFFRFYYICIHTLTLMVHIFFPNL